MIIRQQRNVAAFAGNHRYYIFGQQVASGYAVSVTSAAAANELIAQSRAVSRFVMARVWGRVN